METLSDGCGLPVGRLRLAGCPDWGLVVLRTVRACGDTFAAILTPLQDGLAEFVAFDGELGGFADARAERPYCAAGGPHCHDGSGWICTFAEPVAGAVAEWSGGNEGMAVA
jgi:hypothetical protein